MQYKQGEIMAYGQRGTKKAPPKRCFSKYANIMQLMQWGLFLAENNSLIEHTIIVPHDLF